MDLIRGSKAERNGVRYDRNEEVQRAMESTRTNPPEREWVGDLFELEDVYSASEAEEGWEAVVTNTRRASAKPPY